MVDGGMICVGHNLNCIGKLLQSSFTVVIKYKWKISCLQKMRFEKHMKAINWDEATKSYLAEHMLEEIEAFSEILSK